MNVNNKTTKEQRINLPKSSVTSKTIDRVFGRPEDYIEVHIYNQNNQLLNSIPNFTDFTQPNKSELIWNPISILNNNGYTTGNYKLIFNILRKKIFNTFVKKFVIKAISPTRTELRVIAKDVSNKDLKRASQRYINEISNSPFLRDFILNFGEDKIITGINLIFNENPSTSELLIKLNEPLPKNISTLSTFSINEEITSRIINNQDLGLPEPIDTSISLKGPNFKIDTRLNNSVPSGYKNYDEVLEYSLTSSYQQLLNKLENKEIPEIQYDFVRTPTGSNEGEPQEVTYNFENFIHFGSALERLKNFKYKIELLEQYDTRLFSINSITGPTSASEYVLKDKESTITKKTNILKNLDGYERFLYYESGALSWPKSTTTSPHTLYSITSSQVQTWLGDERSSYSNYGGQLLNADLYDRQNEHSLIRLIPNHILENPDNSFYTTFVNMMGHHYDQIWTYIKHITEINDTHHTRGISKELVYYSLKSLGLDTFDQFENSNLIEYILGEGNTGSIFYDTPLNQTLVTASNAGSIPKGDITKEIWKRLYHNAPYLLKTKGTERGLKALMSCYGVPSTILNVKEYGGPTTDKTTYKTFSYEKSGLALEGNSGEDGYFIKFKWDGLGKSGNQQNLIHNPNSLMQLSASAKTVEFRIKPHRSNETYHLWSLSGSFGGDNVYDHHLMLEPWTGNNISSSGDSTQYGRLVFSRNNNTITKSTKYFPVYNGDFWNIFIGQEDNQSMTVNLKFGAYQSNHLKNVTSVTSTHNIQRKTFARAWGNYSASLGEATSLSLPGTVPHLGFGVGADNCFIGGLPNGPAHNNIDGRSYSGSIQEVRVYYNELLSHDTLTQHALEPFMYSGNSLSSSYENLLLRLPLGSNDQKSSASFNPNEDKKLLEFGGSLPASSNMTTQTWEEVIETHHLPTPDTVGISMTSEKVRIDEGYIDDDWLSPNKKTETSTLDRQPLDYPDLGVFFSPTTEINEDIIYTLGSFRLDDYIGSPLPSAQSASVYKDLSTIRDIYFKKVKRRYNYWDYIKLIQYIDHTLFKLIEQWVPMKANLKTGLLIEPHYLERTKFAREIPTTGVGQSMLNNSYQTFEFQMDPERQFSLTDSAVITTNNPAREPILRFPISTEVFSLKSNNFQASFATNGVSLDITNAENLIQNNHSASINNENVALHLTYNFDTPQFLKKVILDIGDDSFSPTTGSLELSKDGTSYSATAIASVLNNNENEFIVNQNANNPIRYKSFRFQFGGFENVTMTTIKEVKAFNAIETYKLMDQGTNGTINIKEQCSLESNSDFEGNITNGISSNRYYRLRRAN